MSQYRTSIAEYYNLHNEDEWGRLDRHRTEYAITRRALQAHLPPPPARILDCGGGPGRYSIPLAQDGYQVTLFDLSPGNLELARRNADAAGVHLEACEQGTAIDLSRFVDASFDAVLLLGPLYHLLEETERKLALAEARRVLKPGKPLFAALISRYAAHRDAAVKNPEWLITQAELYDEIFQTGRLFPHQREDETPGFTAYFAHPTEAPAPFWEAGLEICQVLGVEGLVSMIETRINPLEGELWERWLELNWQAAHDPSIHGAVEHLLVTAIRPAWRGVLRRVAERLEQEGIVYTVAGGASLALHGLPLLVKDIDFETSPDDAYRFGELFAKFAVEPVRWKESDVYRSHFGSFAVDGVSFEVMGGMQRRQGETWVDTSTRTREIIDLDGTPVWAAWLEEDMLTNIRRGRMERAAECLRRCDPARIVDLLRGEHRTGVI